MPWTPTDAQVNSVATEIVRRECGESYINPVQVALRLNLARTILERAYVLVPEIIIGLVNADVSKG